MVERPLLPITKESSFKSSTASTSFSLASPQYSFVTTVIWSIKSFGDKRKWKYETQNWKRKMKKYSAKTSFCLEPVSRMSRTSISIGTSYFFITSGSRNSTNGIKAAITQKSKLENPPITDLNQHRITSDDRFQCAN